MFDATVVAASREWICVRLATYENKAEGAFLEGIFTGRSGNLENTTFALLAPDGKTPLSRAGRGPHSVTGARRGPPERRSGPPDSSGGGVDTKEASKLASVLDAHRKRHKPKSSIKALPQGLDFRRALNVAACDNQPLVVAYARSKSTRDVMTKTLATLAWSQAFVGRLQYIVVSDRKDLSTIKDMPKAEGIFVIQPGRFGLTGSVLESATAKANEQSVAAMFNKGLSKFKSATKDTRDQRRAARREGVAPWESEIPVTDPGIPPGGRRGGR